uniref:Uncharacterized protein n=1 Tax=Vombatus ursinus TaxID=29139 RepID=A0A4X2KWS6_VOMUR
VGQESDTESSKNPSHLPKEQKEKVPTFPQVSRPEYLPPSKDPQQNSTLIQDISGSGKPWMKGSKEFASSCESSLEDQVSDHGVVSANEGAELPRKMEDLATPFDSVVGKSNLSGLYDREGSKKIKKRVSFSEELFLEEEVEKEKNRLIVLKSKGVVNDTLFDSEPEEIEKKKMTTEPNSLSSPVLMLESHGKRFLEDLTRESSSEKATPSFRIERYENYSENYQSKASDLEGLLSDPLRSLGSVSDLRSPVMGDLNLTLPSIPEVTSDDERVEQLEDVRTTPTSKNHLEKETPFFCSSATSSEEENLSPDAGVSTLFHEEQNALRMEKPEDFVNSSILSSKQTTALGVCKLHGGEGLGLDKDILIPESLEKQEWREEDNHTEESRSQRSSSQGCPVSGHSLSENFNATHSFPGSLHSDTYHTNRAESPQKTSAESSAAKVENSDKTKQLLRAWVSPSEPHPFPAQPTGGTTVSAKHR